MQLMQGGGIGKNLLLRIVAVLFIQLKMEVLEFTSKEAAAPLMSLAAPLWFWKFWKKILDFGIFFRNFEFFENFENYEL